MTEMRGNRQGTSKLSQALGSKDPRARRSAQVGTTNLDLNEPLYNDNSGRITVRLDGALYTTPDGKLAIRLGNGLKVAHGSPMMLQIDFDPETMVVLPSGKISASLKSSQIKNDTTVSGTTLSEAVEVLNGLVAASVSPAVFSGAGYDGLVPDPVTESGKYLEDDGTWSHPFALTETEVDFGSAPVSSKSFTITDASVSTASKIVVFPSGNAPTSGYADVWEWDTIGMAAEPGTGEFTLHCNVPSGTTNGKRKVLYAVT